VSLLVNNDDADGFDRTADDPCLNNSDQKDSKWHLSQQNAITAFVGIKIDSEPVYPFFQTLIDERLYVSIQNF
jgi:hypothetical protein